MLAHRWLKGHVQWEVSFWLSGLEMKYLRQCLLGLAGSPTVKGEEEGMGGGDGRRGWEEGVGGGDGRRGWEEGEGGHI